MHTPACEQTVRHETLEAPDELKRDLPLSEAGGHFVAAARRDIEAVLSGADRRLLVIVGPCSIHDPRSALEYAQRLRPLRERLSDELLICMRVYFEKPRTTVGWKGLINDPRLDGSCDVRAGLRLGRELLVALADLGLPAATETLDPISPPYLADTVAWTAIGARTTESQTHREIASALALPVGFKNGTGGELAPAINAMLAARAAHSFIGVDERGRPAVVRAAGNSRTHLILRGGRSGPNYAAPSVDAASQQLLRHGLQPRVVIDCSHDNSAKNHENQRHVVHDIASQLERGSESILGIMLESHLRAGRQDLVAGRTLTYGQSITDACLDFEQTTELLVSLAGTLARMTRRARPERTATLDQFGGAPA